MAFHNGTIGFNPIDGQSHPSFVQAAVGDMQSVPIMPWHAVTDGEDIALCGTAVTSVGLPWHTGTGEWCVECEELAGRVPA